MRWRDRWRRSVHAPMLLEVAMLLAIIALCWWLGTVAHGAWRTQAQALVNVTLPEASEARALARHANLLFTLGVGLLGAGRVVSLLRRRDPISVPLLIPALALVCLLGLVVHHATVEVVTRTIDGQRHAIVLVPSAASFAEGFAMGALGAALLMVLPFDPATLAIRLRLPIALLMGGIFIALAFAGSGPTGSGTRINLGPVQPIEAVKILLVLFLAANLGARASKLRWQRQRFLGLLWPRITLLLPAVLVLLAIFAGLYVIGDLGPVSILAFVFLGTFYVVTRATGWAVLSLTIITSIVTLATMRTDLVGVGRVVTRIRMWQEPWWNGIAYGDQLGESLWAIAAGGPFGQGLAEAHTPIVAAGKTDLILATLAEQLGAAGVLVYVALLTTIVLSGFFVAARTRTSERALLAAGASLLLVVQWAIIHAGTFGVLPLTGVVVPFLSAGRSSMVAFVVLVGMLARVAEDGPIRVPLVEIDELQSGVRALAGVACVLFIVGASTAVRIGTLDDETISAMSISTRLGDGTLVSRSNPRLVAMANALRRGSITDRNGAPLAVTANASSPTRRYPLGSAMGTLLGVHPSRVLLPTWALERRFEERLRGYGDRTDGPTHNPWPDLRAFAPLLSLPANERAQRLRALDAAIEPRSVRLSIDARLQREVATRLASAVRERGHLAAAAVVIDVDTGEVLARAQVPDLDPNDDTWQSNRLRGEPGFNARFTGAYGPWSDKTGARGHFQSGSVGKLFTALAAARVEGHVTGDACAARTDAHFMCNERDDQGPFFTRPGWSRPIHDHFRDATHGNVDLVEAIAVSCNVFFGQLALQLGPQPLVALRDAGVDVGYGGSRRFDPGASGSRQLASTGFGQGALVMNVVQAARLVAAIGSGGHYRACPSTMALVRPCADVLLVPDPRSLAPVLAGMRRVMTSGTGHSLDEPEGTRIYGKTGTADVQGFAGEEPFGIVRGQSARPHSWFVALAESDTSPECAPSAPHRIAVAVVVPRGGSGASAAGPIAMEIVSATRALGYLGTAR